MIDIQILWNANAISSTLSRECFSMNAERQILVRFSQVSPFPFPASAQLMKGLSTSGTMGSGWARKNNITTRYRLFFLAIKKKCSALVLQLASFSLKARFCSYRIKRNVDSSLKLIDHHGRDGKQFSFTP